MKISICLFLAPCWFITTVSGQGLLDTAARFLKESRPYLDEEPPDAQQILPEYDFIVVGAGSAGCVLVNRLTEVYNWTVLLIEAGDKESNYQNIPGMAPYLLLTDSNWKYSYQPSNVCLDMENRQCHIDRGKVMGGSSAINFLMYTRGNKHNYDDWERMGNPGWGWKEVLPLFLKLENMKIPELAKDYKYHSTEGALPVSQARQRTPLASAFVRGGTELGYNEVDVNGANPTGFSYLHSTTLHGRRWSASKAFLHPIRKRKNFHVSKKSMVTKIMINPKTKTAYGVEFIRNNRRVVVRARKEVIVSGGAINSPQILMLSGIGPKKLLSQLGIPLVQDLKVGYNLMDHPGMPTIFTINKPVSYVEDEIWSLAFRHWYDYVTKREGPLSIPVTIEGYAFLDSGNRNASHGNNDVELVFIAGGLQNSLFLQRILGYSENFSRRYLKPIEGKHSFTLIPMVMTPKSRGRVTLKTKNPFDKPVVYYDFYQHPDDMDTQLRAIKIMLELAGTPAFQKFGAKLYNKPIPGCEGLRFASDKYWRCAVRHAAMGLYHVSGTCKMGPDVDRSAVVNSRLQVHGVKRLRVIDASIMPTIPAAHTNVPAMMIGENGARFLKQDWGVR